MEYCHGVRIAESNVTEADWEDTEKQKRADKLATGQQPISKAQFHQSTTSLSRF
jgi:hypothetical protein